MRFDDLHRVECDAYGLAGSAMANLANTYAALGRHTDALVIENRCWSFSNACYPRTIPR